MKINYSVLRPCQVVICAGRPWIIKLLLWIASFFRKWPSKEEPTYVGIVYETRGEYLIANMPNKKGVILSSFENFLSKTRYIIDIKDGKMSYAERERVQQLIAKEFRYILSKTGEHKDKGITNKVTNLAEKGKTDELFVSFLLNDYAGWESVDNWSYDG